MTCWIFAVALAAAFLLLLAVKWGILEWLQVHAPSDFLHELFTCHFCTTFWTCAAISLSLFVATGRWQMLFIAPLATVIARKLW